MILSWFVSCIRREPAENAPALVRILQDQGEKARAWRRHSSGARAPHAPGARVPNGGEKTRGVSGLARRSPTATNNLWHYKCHDNGTGWQFGAPAVLQVKRALRVSEALGISAPRDQVYRLAAHRIAPSVDKGCLVCKRMVHRHTRFRVEFETDARFSRDDSVLCCGNNE